MRNFNEMVTDALAQRRKLLDAGQDPFASDFIVTPREMATIQLQPQFNVSVNIEKKTICGLKIRVAHSAKG